MTSDADAGDADIRLYDPGVDATLGAEDDGLHQIAVRRPDGGRDTVWIMAVSPPGDGPFPTVVYAHGQANFGGVSNCKPGETMAFGSLRAEMLAEAGYLAVAIFYRHTGEGAPGVGQLRVRDHYTWDASAMLAAARWARDYHRKGTDQVALFGSSAGTWPTTWAVSDHRDLEPLQQGLRIRTAIAAAETANEIANSGRKWDRLGDLTGGELAGAALGNGLNLAMWVARSHRVPLLSAADFRPGSPLGDDVAALVTPRALELQEQGLFTEAQSLYEAHPSELPSCEGGVGVPPECSEECGLEVIRYFAMQVPGYEDATTWVTPRVLEAADYWEPPDRIDPGAETDNVGLAAWRSLSPAYAAEGPARTDRLLLLLSENDSHYDPESRDLYVRTIEGMGVETVTAPRITVDASGVACGHLDYVDPARPSCGYRALLDELDAAFADL